MENCRLRMVKRMEEAATKKAIETLKANKIRWVHSVFVDVRGLMQDMIIPASVAVAIGFSPNI